jgi:hypothetical protein
MAVLLVVFILCLPFFGSCPLASGSNNPHHTMRMKPTAAADKFVSSGRVSIK